MKQTKQLILTIVLVSFAGIVNIGAFAMDKRAQQQTKAQGLWEAAVVAKGGRERLLGVRSLYVAAQGERDHWHDVYVFPNRSFNYSYWADQERIDIDVYNGGRNTTWWITDTAKMASVKRGTDTEESGMKEAQFIFLLETNWLKPKPVRAHKGWVGINRVDVVETDVDGWRVDYYMDPKTRLPMQVTYGYSYIEREQGEMNSVVRLEEYREVNGIMMPHRVTYSGARSTKQKVSYEMNVDYDEEVFEQPPKPHMRHDAWRRKARP